MPKGERQVTLVPIVIERIDGKVSEGCETCTMMLAARVRGGAGRQGRAIRSGEGDGSSAMGGNADIRP